MRRKTARRAAAHRLATFLATQADNYRDFRDSNFVKPTWKLLKEKDKRKMQIEDICKRQVVELSIHFIQTNTSSKPRQPLNINTT